MPTSCSVYGCSNRFSKEKKIQFFTFPFKDECRLAAWITAVRRKDWKPSKASRICSTHFKPQDFLHRPGTAWYPHIRRLKHDAVPSVFSNIPENLESKRAKNENFSSAIIKGESEFRVKSKSNFLASEVCSNKLDSCMKESNVNSKENTGQTEDNSSESEKDQTITKLRDKIHTLKQQIDKRDRKIRCMKDLILRLRRNENNVVTWKLQNENRMSVTIRRMCRRSVAPQIKLR